MLLFFILGASAWLVSAQSTSQGKTTVVMCGSFSCVYNRRARCTRRKIAVYDNKVIGLCLYHSADMGKRILEPMGKGIVVEKSKPNPQIISGIMKAWEVKRDSELVNNPKAFARWIKKQLPKERQKDDK